MFYHFKSKGYTNYINLWWNQIKMSKRRKIAKNIGYDFSLQYNAERDFTDKEREKLEKIINEISKVV